MPTVTNVNNASICTGTWPAVHGITANSYLDLVTREEHYMDRAELLLAPTLFERAARAGRRSALLTAKVKTIRMLARGADLTLAAEAPDPSWVARLGPPPEIYSAEINHWLLDAAALGAPDSSGRRRRLLPHDRLPDAHVSAGRESCPSATSRSWTVGSAAILDACPDLAVYVTADHGMNAKRRCYDLARALAEAGRPILFAMSAERDPYVRHHRTFGGTAYVWLEAPGDREGVDDGAPRPRGRRRRADPPRGGRSASGSTPTASATSSCSGTATPSSARSSARSRTSRRASAPTDPVTSSACRSSCTVSRSPDRTGSPTRTTSTSCARSRSRVVPVSTDAGLVAMVGGLLAFVIGLGVLVLRVPRCPGCRRPGVADARTIADAHPALIEVLYECRACGIVVSRRTLGYPGEWSLPRR